MNVTKEIDYDKIIKECFWDYHITVNDLKSLKKSNDKLLLKKVFEKIIYNASDKLFALTLFKKDDLNLLLREFVPTYNKKYIEKHLLVLKSLILNEHTSIKTLEWREK